MNKLFYTLLFILLLLFSCEEKNNKNKLENDITKENSEEDHSHQQFVKVSSSESGISFRNTILDTITTKSNLFDFDFFYNGAGVGIADINNDGLKDVFFCGNQVPNKLYLNKGNLVFEDLSESANINSKKIRSKNYLLKRAKCV